MGCFFMLSDEEKMYCIIYNSGIDIILQITTIFDDFCFGVDKPPTLENFLKIINIFESLSNGDAVVRGSVCYGKISVWKSGLATGKRPGLDRTKTD